jgi:purine-binding chemotaxis protein CheW
VVVDSVSDVLDLDPLYRRDAPEMSSGVDASYILGLGTPQDRMLILVDIEKLINARELGLIE